jgi:hypothetical protein
MSILHGSTNRIKCKYALIDYANNQVNISLPKEQNFEELLFKYELSSLAYKLITNVEILIDTSHTTLNFNMLKKYKSKSITVNLKDYFDGLPSYYEKYKIEIIKNMRNIRHVNWIKNIFFGLYEGYHTNEIIDKIVNNLNNYTNEYCSDLVLTEITGDIQNKIFIDTPINIVNRLHEV